MNTKNKKLHPYRSKKGLEQRGLMRLQLDVTKVGMARLTAIGRSLSGYNELSDRGFQTALWEKLCAHPNADAIIREILGL